MVEHGDMWMMVTIFRDGLVTITPVLAPSSTYQQLLTIGWAPKQPKQTYDGNTKTLQRVVTDSALKISNSVRIRTLKLSNFERFRTVKIYDRVL